MTIMQYVRDNIASACGYVPGFQPGSDAVKLNTNENPYPPSDKVLDEIRSIAADQLRRYPQPMGSLFRETAAEVLGLKPENIICTNGGDDLLTICFRAFCDKSSPAIWPGPTYSLYPVLAKLQNCSYKEIPFGYDNTLPEAEIVDSDAGLVIICNPNAPTGLFIEPGIIERVANKLQGKSAVLVDEAYVDFAYDNCLRLIEKCENLIILRSMSKGYSLAGIRFGFGVAQKQITEQLLKVKDSYNVDTVSIRAASAAIKDREYFICNVEKIRAQREIITSKLEKLGFKVNKSETNFVLAQKDNAREIYEKLIEKKIYVRYFDIEGLTDKLRITVGTAEQNEALIAGIADITGKKDY
jgi:histidinol-phosphate aminotransferase